MHRAAETTVCTESAAASLHALQPSQPGQHTSLVQRACRTTYSQTRQNFCKDETPGPKLCGSHGVRRPTDSRRPVHCCSCSDVVWLPASLGLWWRASVLKATQLMEGRLSELLVVGKLTTSRPRGHSGPQLARPPAPCPWHCVRPSN